MPWQITAALAAALVVAGWLLWGQIERNGELSAHIEAERAATAAVEAALERQKLETQKQREIVDAGDRAVTQLGEARDVVQTRTVVVVREIRAQPEAAAGARPALRHAYRRMHELAADADRRGRAPGADGAAGGAGPGPGAAGAARPGQPDRR